jgi:4-hydroxy-tetrahydrodipicolinate reductase
MIFLRSNNGVLMNPQLIVTGAAGRMGRRIIALAIENGQFDIVGATEKAGHADLGADAGLLAGAKAINVQLKSTYPSNADVMIDFSLPEAVGPGLEYCVNNKVALVLGTTGLTEAQIQQLKNVSSRIAVVQATNMSVGMNVLFSLVGKVARMLGPDYDVEIVEEHHRFKKDAPSGSALSLARNIAAEQGWPFPDCLTHGRSGKETLRRPQTIGMHAVRAGDIVGEHEVIFSSLGETVTLSHSAHSRDNFARGALRAALWLVGKNPGLYSMLDVLGLK